MNNLRQAAQAALEALDDSIPVGVITLEKFYSAKEALRAALAEPQPEPYCYIYEYDSPFGLHREFYPSEWNGLKPSRTIALHAAPQTQRQPTFNRGDRVRKRSGSAWQGRVVGEYSTALTPDGYAVESEAHPGSVQIYPAKALEDINE